MQPSMGKAESTKIPSSFTQRQGFDAWLPKNHVGNRHINAIGRPKSTEIYGSRRADGYVTLTKPLSYKRSSKGLKVTFKDGQIVDTLPKSRSWKILPLKMWRVPKKCACTSPPVRCHLMRMLQITIGTYDRALRSEMSEEGLGLTTRCSRDFMWLVRSFDIDGIREDGTRVPPPFRNGD